MSGAGPYSAPNAARCLDWSGSVLRLHPGARTLISTLCLQVVVELPKADLAGSLSDLGNYEIQKLILVNVF